MMRALAIVLVPTALLGLVVFGLSGQVLWGRALLGSAATTFQLLMEVVAWPCLVAALMGMIVRNRGQVRAVAGLKRRLGWATMTWLMLLFVATALFARSLNAFDGVTVVPWHGMAVSANNDAGYLKFGSSVGLTSLDPGVHAEVGRMRVAGSPMFGQFNWRYLCRAGRGDPGQYYVSMTLPYPAILLILLLLAARSVRAFWNRARPAVCVACGYDLTGNSSGLCPECGSKIRDSHLFSAVENR